MSGVSSLTTNDILQWDSANWTNTTVLVGVTASTIVAAGDSGQVLTSNGADPPNFKDAAKLTVNAGTTTRPGDSSGTGSQGIKHSLGKVPTYVRFTATKGIGNANHTQSWGFATSSTQVSVGFSTHTASDMDGYTSNIRCIDIKDEGDSDKMTATAFLSATEIELDWIITGSPTGETIHILWEVGS